jgi:hypothetical protein
MDGNEKIEEALFNFTESGLKISAVTPSKINRVDATLKTSAFISYEAIEKIGVQDITTLIKIIGKFSDEIELIVEGNIIKLKDGNKEMTTELIDVQFITAVKDMKELEFDDSFTIKVEKIKSAIDDASINGEYNLEFKTGEKAFQISTSGKYKFKRNYIVEEANGGVEVAFGEPLVNAVKNLTGKIELNLKSNFPAKILEKTEHSIISLIVSPRIKSD